MDNCSFLKDADCSLRIGRLVLRQEKLNNLWPRARVEVLLSLEVLAKKDGKYKTEYVQELKKYADSQTSAKEWLAFSKKLTAIYLNEKLNAEAEPYLIKIFQKEGNTENLYRKIYCQYQLQKYAEILDHLHQIPKVGPLANDIKTLVRESSLSLAKASAEKDRFSEYEKHLFQYLNLDPEPEKAEIAHADYLQRLLERQAFEKVIAEFNKLPPQKKFHGAYAKTMDQLMLLLFSMNRFQEAHDVLAKGAIFGQFRNFDDFWLRSLVALNGGLNERELKILVTTPPATRLAFLSLAALAQPRLVVTYFNLANPVDDKEKKIWLLSRQMVEGLRAVTLTDRETQKLADILSPLSLAAAPFKSEKLIKMVEFPQPSWSQERLSRVTPDAMERVRDIRRQIFKDLDGQTPEVQKRLLINGVVTEKKMGWFFDESPVPEGMSKDELRQYRKEIDAFASEYYQQAAEYQKLLAAVMSRENELFADRLPLPTNVEHWTRSRRSPLDLVDGEIRKGQTVRALIVLESQKSLEKVALGEYYRWRSFIVMNEFPHDVAASYLQDELLATNQADIILDWRELVGLAEIDQRNLASEVAKPKKGGK
jgi:hypothetical protein